MCVYISVPSRVVQDCSPSVKVCVYISVISRVVQDCSPIV